MIERAYVTGARAGQGLSDLNALVARLSQRFVSAGAEAVEPPSLLPAATLLDIYGEDIRGRAYITRDSAGEQVLRPDFTVPLVEWYLRQGGAPSPARYAYAGPVWRQQSGDAAKREQLQAGFEFFGDARVEAADAQAFALVCDSVGLGPGAALRGSDGLQLVTGDLGLILAAVDGLETSAARRAALRRHVWRPGRFQRLLDQYGPGHGAWVAARKTHGPRTAIGVRSAGDVEDRLALLEEEAATPPLAPAQTGALLDVLNLGGSLRDAAVELPRLSADLPGLAPASARFEARLDALAEAGFDPSAIPFEGTYGRTSLEYYDGFVFGVVAPARPDLPVLASGGRYDRLLAALGQAGRAVGGSVRPEALLSWGRG
ncbi:MAG: ATP phosphoribosyltransferase regulatory subunit [Pseudomonadota bacterium]